MLDLNYTPYIDAQAASPIRDFLSGQRIHIPATAESSLTMDKELSKCDEAFGRVSTVALSNDGNLVLRLKEFMSAEHSSITASSGPSTKNINDPTFVVECEASSEHAAPLTELIRESNLSNLRSTLHFDSPSNGSMPLGCTNAHKPPDEGSHVHDVGHCNQSLDDCNISLEGNSSCNEVRSFPTRSPAGSMISTNVGMIEESNSTCLLQDQPPAFKTSLTRPWPVEDESNLQASRQDSMEVDQDTTKAATRQLFPLRPLLRRDGLECSLDKGELGDGITHAPTVSRPIVVHSPIVAAPNVLLSYGPSMNTMLDHVGTTPPKPFPPLMSLSFSSNSQVPTMPTISHLAPIMNGVQPLKKSRRGPRSRSSQYRGVTFYRRTGRWESHIWDCGKQVYLGGFDTAHAAARAYDRAALRFRGLDADINFHLSDYETDIKQMNCVSKDEFVHLLRRQGMGFSRGSSRYRGMALHKCGKWESRMGCLVVSKRTGDEAPNHANGRDASANLVPRYQTESEHCAPADDLELRLGTTTPSTQQHLQRKNNNMEVLNSHTVSLTMAMDDSKPGAWLKHQSTPGCFKQTGDHNQQSSLVHSQIGSHGQLLTIDNKSALSSDPASGFKAFKAAGEALEDRNLAVKGMAYIPEHLEPYPFHVAQTSPAGGWALQGQQNTCAAAAVLPCSTLSAAHAHASTQIHVAAASSGFSPQLSKQQQEGQQEKYAFPQWLHKTGFSYLSVPWLADS